MSSELFHRVHMVTAKAELLVIARQFDTTGPIHYFADHNHGRNFCRYLFSQTKAHPTNHLTGRNMFCEKESDVETRRGYLDAPEKIFKNFMARRFPKQDADKTLCDDGAYLGFCFLMPDRHLVTNLLERGPGTDEFLMDGMFGEIGGEDSDLSMIEAMMEKADDMTAFDSVTGPDPRCEMADLLVQKLVSKRMGGNPLLTISHRDQLDHNQTYHFHRLIAI